MNTWLKVGVAVVLLAAGFGAGEWVRGLSATADLASAESAHATDKEKWERQRADLATQRTAAISAQQLAERNQATAIHEAAQNYQRGKADAERNAAQAMAELDAGTRRLRDEWATCRATAGTLAAAVPSAGAGHGADGLDRLREGGIRRVLSVVGQCQAQRDALQAALIGERKQEHP